MLEGGRRNTEERSEGEPRPQGENQLHFTGSQTSRIDFEQCESKQRGNGDCLGPRKTSAIAPYKGLGVKERDDNPQDDAVKWAEKANRQTTEKEGQQNEVAYGH